MKLALRALGSMFGLLALLFFVFALVNLGGGKGSGGSDEAGGELQIKLSVKDKVISGAYKVYGLRSDDINLWLGKTVFTNQTGGIIKDLRVRYKLGEYADWCSWQEHPKLVPTQTVVDLYNPILSSKIASLTSRTPGELQMEAEYTLADGTKKTLQKSERLTVLSPQEFYFTDLGSEERTGSFQDFSTNAHLLAAWVTSQDLAVSGLASMANKLAGGVGATQNDQAALQVMAALYEIMRGIGITYQHPQAQVEQNKSFDIMLVQTLQYPRDTIRKRSGTCIDLALLYASMMSSVGLRAALVLLDGHAFPMGITPTGRLIPVEATGVGGGGQKSADFNQVVNIGAKEWNELQQTGRYVLVEVQKAWGLGITAAELPALPADILDRWKITDLLSGRRIAVPTGGGEGTAQGGGGEGGGNEGGGGSEIQAMAQGNWSFSVTQANGRKLSGQAQVGYEGGQLKMYFVLRYSAPGADGQIHQAQEQNLFIGSQSGRTVAAQCTQAVWTLDGTQIPAQGLPYRMKLTVAQNGRSASGIVVGSTGESVRLSMKAR